ncbi:MAG: hypothetical protein P4L59_20085 [Desulfosporosinus sp.]|nr:hypothetical protein [Desulfosporosinus sp.]
MQSAGLSADLRGKNADLAGITEKLAASKSQYDTDERMRNLEYSLKKLSQETLQTLASTLVQLSQEKADRETLRDQVKRDTTNLERDLISYAGEQGSLQQEAKQYVNHERDVLAKLKLSLNRNLLGELSGNSKKVHPLSGGARSRTRGGYSGRPGGTIESLEGEL